ncbi:hypothetical protein CPB84DRAFT_1692014, partial [Gymnopilus junonius]
MSVNPSEAESEISVNDEEHLQPADDVLKESIIKEWEEVTSHNNICMVVCSVCGIMERSALTAVMDAEDIELSLLRNDELPEAVLPTSYNFEAYDRAILNPKGLHKKESIGRMIVCLPCARSLRSGDMPRFALANWLYYGRERVPEDITNDFIEASVFERMLYGRARYNTVCCKFDLDGKNEPPKKSSRLKKGIRGNVVVAPLNAVRLYDILPPNVTECFDTMSAVFVANETPTSSTISKLSPVLVRKSRIRRILAFLLENNPHYGEDTGLRISGSNLDSIHDSEDVPDIPKTVAIGHLSPRQAFKGVNSDYTPRNEDDFIEDERTDNLMMENVSYTEGDESTKSYYAMKLLALERCMSGKSFVTSGTGGQFIPDFHNPRLLAWLFPNLDPWGIGGFHEPKRRVKLSMKEQVAHLLRSDDRAFEEDPEFAFVFFNILRKAEATRGVRFHVPGKEQERIVTELRTLDVNDLRSLCKKTQTDPMYKPLDGEEKRIVNLMKSITMSTHSLPGSNGYKKTMRNQIRGVICAKGCPALFITLNPSDVDHPLVKVFAGDSIDIDDVFRGEEMDSWRRRVFAAKKPAACALFFDFMIQNFIKVILAHGTGHRGLYGI